MIWTTILFLMTLYMLYSNILAYKIIYANKETKEINREIKQKLLDEKDNDKKFSVMIFISVIGIISSVFWLLIAFNTAYFFIALISLFNVIMIAFNLSSFLDSFATKTVKPQSKLLNYITPLSTATLIFFIIELLQRIIN